MKMNKKRILAFLLTLTLALSCSITSFAAEPTKEVSNRTETNEVMPRASTYIAGMHIDETSSTSETKSNFLVGLFRSATMSGSITVDQPCSVFIIIYDSNGRALGTSSKTMTRAGTFNISIVPSTLSYGNYTYGYMFDRAGVNYDLYIYATM